MKKLAIALILISVAAIGHFLLTEETRPAPAAPERADLTLRSTTAGDVVGFVDTSGARAWLGIPFAEAPTGSLRWRAPQPPVPWSGVREALAVGRACPQLKSSMTATRFRGRRGA